MDNVGYYALDIYFRKKLIIRRDLLERLILILKSYLFLKLSSSLRKTNSVYLFLILRALLLLGLTYRHGSDLNKHQSAEKTSMAFSTVVDLSPPLKPWSRNKWPYIGTVDLKSWILAFSIFLKVPPKQRTYGFATLCCFSQDLMRPLAWTSEFDLLTC